MITKQLDWVGWIISDVCACVRVCVCVCLVFENEYFPGSTTLEDPIHSICNATVMIDMLRHIEYLDRSLHDFRYPKISARKLGPPSSFTVGTIPTGISLEVSS